MIHPSSIRFYLIVTAASLGTSGLIYGTMIFNNTVGILKEFISSNYYNRNGYYPTEMFVAVVYSILSGAVAFGAIVGAAFGSVVSEKIGRKRGILLLSAINIFGTVLAVIATPTGLYQLMIVGRLIQGIAMGLAYAIGGLYLVEISPTNRRGFVSSFLQLFTSLGGFLAVLLGMPFALGTPEYLWLLQFLQAIPSIIMFMWLPFCPETPGYLYLSRNDKTAAMESIIFYHTSQHLFSVLEDLEHEEVNNANIRYINWMELFGGEYRKVFSIAIVCIIGYSASGISIITCFTTSILVDSGVKFGMAQEMTIVTFVIGIVVTVPWMILVEKNGRRITFLVGMYGIFVVTVLFTVFRSLTSSHQWASAVCVALIILNYVANIAGNMVHWFIVNEMFDQKARSQAVTICSVLQWLVTAIALAIFYPVMKVSNSGYAMLPIGLIALATAIFASIFLPETKNRTFLDVIESVSHSYRNTNECEDTPLN